MIRSFKFFHGINNKLTVSWQPVEGGYIGNQHAFYAETELTRLLSEEIAREIDNDIVDELTRRINGGNQLNSLQERVDYFNRWMDIDGGQRA